MERPEIDRLIEQPAALHPEAGVERTKETAFKVFSRSRGALAPSVSLPGSGKDCVLLA